PGRQVTLAADPVQAEPAAGDRDGAGVAAQDPGQPGDGEADEDRVFGDGHGDLGPGGELDPGDRDDEHDEQDGGADGDVRGGAGGVGAGHGQDGGGQDHDAGDVGGDHQPAGEEAQVGVDG